MSRGGFEIALTLTEALLRLALAVVIGMAIGFEREWREKAAGFRTITLVAAGSALFILGAEVVGFGPAERSRIAQGIVTGIGFLGAGTILRDRGEVVGLTTAATVWAACALGIAAAFGAYVVAIAGAALVLLVLIVFPWFRIGSHEVRTYELTRRGKAGEERAGEVFRRHGLSSRQVSVSREGDLVHVVWQVSGALRGHEEVTRALLEDADFISVDVR